MDAQQKDYLIGGMLASELLEAYEKRKFLRGFRDPEPILQARERDPDTGTMSHIAGLVRRLCLIRVQGPQALDVDEPVSWLRQLMQLQNNKRHIELFREFAPDRAELFESERRQECSRVGRHLTWLALG